MKSIGIVICNYNKKDYCLRCIQCVLESTTDDYDIFVVDNASTDGSAAAIRTAYGDKVTLLENKENLGGSGGFNTGIRKVVELGYEYLMCLDNDAQVDENAIQALRHFLREHPDVGMAGSKVYHLQEPDYIQQYGLLIDFDHFCARTLYADTPDSPDIPDVVYCDTVAACSVMLPVAVVREVGGLPEDNFIYWDDMEWGYLIKKAGYKVAACGSSMALHEMAANVRKANTFSSYYLWRNSLDFFMRHTPDEKLEAMSVTLLRSVFESIYECMYREEHNVAKTIFSAYQDAMNHVRGQAPSGRIFSNDGNINQFEKLLERHSSCCILDVSAQDSGRPLKDSASLADCLMSRIQSINPDMAIIPDPDQADLCFTPCNSIMDISDFSLETCYVDRQLNVMASKEDAQLIQNLPYCLQLFLYMNQSFFLQAAAALRK